MEKADKTHIKNFYVISIIALVFKCIIAFLFPLTGDEAYYINIARSPGLGFYDQPPMVTWWLAALAYFSKSIFFFKASVNSTWKHSFFNNI